MERKLKRRQAVKPASSRSLRRNRSRVAVGVIEKWPSGARPSVQGVGGGCCSLGLYLIVPGTYVRVCFSIRVCFTAV